MEKRDENKKPSLKVNKDKYHSNQNKHINWDWQSLEEQDRERKANPKKKINDPKTPYYCNEELGEDDEYLKNLTTINKTTVIYIFYLRLTL
jgi:hypothetical protein